ncbi:MAG: hypothetical protein HY074_00810 [Deltaproteobacteria bacterium]|nr:hypothetical protein [Deltaproteobacteria bacterium]
MQSAIPVEHYESQPAAQPRSVDLVLTGAGIIDQAVRGLIELRELSLTQDGPPRSPLLEIVSVYHRFARSPNLLGQVSLLGSAGGTGIRLVREWGKVLDRDAALLKARRPARIYMIASLAVASLIVPWLLLRKRDGSQSPVNAAKADK